MKLIRTEDAVGSVLCHDITQIIPGVDSRALRGKGMSSRKRTSLSCSPWGKSICMCGRSRKGCSMKMMRQRCCVRCVRAAI